ncbi:MAG: RHS repeat-associated protein [Vicingaceae bacterium]|jgi:RHS repeat-associated protein
MQMPGRSFTSGNGYRYGFQGQERDDEVKGSGNSYDFGARIYDSRIGKFLSTDPREKYFPFWSPYLFAGNSPISFIDVYGEGPGKPIWSSRGVLKLVNSSEIATKMFKQLGGDWEILRVSGINGVGAKGHVAATDHDNKKIIINKNLSNNEAFTWLVFEMQNALQESAFNSIESAAARGFYESSADEYNKFYKSQGFNNNTTTAGKEYGKSVANIELRSLMTKNQVSLEQEGKTVLSTNKIDGLISKFNKKYNGEIIGNVYNQGADRNGNYNGNGNRKAFRLAKKVYNQYQKEIQNRYTDIGASYEEQVRDYEKYYNKEYGD